MIYVEGAIVIEKMKLIIISVMDITSFLKHGFCSCVSI